MNDSPRGGTAPFLPKYGKKTMLSVMGTMNISLPDGMKEFVDQQVAQRGYGTSGH